jgi:hypothetical protein
LSQLTSSVFGAFLGEAPVSIKPSVNSSDIRSVGFGSGLLTLPRLHYVKAVGFFGLIPFWILDFRFWIVKALSVGSFTNSNVASLNPIGLKGTLFF